MGDGFGKGRHDLMISGFALVAPAGGADKVSQILALLRSEFLDGLVTDEVTAPGDPGRERRRVRGGQRGSVSGPEHGRGSGAGEGATERRGQCATANGRCGSRSSICAWR